MAEVAQVLVSRLDALRGEMGDTVPMAELVAATEQVVATLEGDLSGSELGMRRELAELARFIEDTRREVAAIRSDDIRSRLPQAKDELDAVVAATEQAAGTFLGAAEQLTDLAEKLEAATGDILRDIATNIYEASSFQDITGQRISKVIKAIRHIEERIGALAHIADGAAPPPAPAVEEDEGDPDAKLLHGPQLDGQGNSQAEIDALLASFD
ncbi:protein phosphatase CheZ [Desertibaculum subflavum]|uniref:protein phosphatase CheZ n=1 Tax=Desertibaculum subflavum TaxID=2268458 RepID=UPI000E666D97